MSNKIDKIIYRSATLADIDGIIALQKLYHVDTVSDTDKPDGFVTTLFTAEQIAELIRDSNNEGNVIVIAIAIDEQSDEVVNKVIGYAMNASWHYWSAWVFFQYMIADLPNVSFNGQACTTDNSYQYGPVCVHADYRGGDGVKSVLVNLFEQSRVMMSEHYPILLTFINHINPRSYEAHVRKLGLSVIKDFTYNDNNYWELGYDTSVSVIDG